MKMHRFIVISCEHTDSFDDRPILRGSFETRNEAEVFVEKCVDSSLKEFPNEEEVDFGLVQTFDDYKNPKYGCIWEIIDTENPPLTIRTKI